MPSNSLRRAPTLAVSVNGAPLAGVFAAEITSNNHLAADRFSVSAAIAAPADAPQLTDTPDLAIDIAIALNGEPPTSLVQGDVDAVEFDPIAGTFRLTGRDFSARLIEARTQETFANQTSSDIATTLANRSGLAADVQPTTTPVGAYWQLEHDAITLDQFARARAEWDLLVSLAAHEGFDVWVSDTTLHFRPATAPSRAPTTLRATATLAGPPNVTALRLDRSVTLGRTISVTVRSWNNRRQAAFSQTATTSADAGRSSQLLDYVFVVPNLTPDQALAIAQRRLADIISHERIVTADMPGDLALFPRMFVAVEGTGTSFDQLFIIDEVERRYDLRDGFTQRVRGRSCNVS